MKILLLDIKPKTSKYCLNKDLAGGMGTKTWVGKSLRAKIFEHLKKKNVVLPNITIAYLAAIFRDAGWEVKFFEVEDAKQVYEEKVDLVLAPTSIVDCEHEREIADNLKKQNFKVGVYGAFASAAPEFFINQADFVIKGEAEAGILEILSSQIIPRGILDVEPVVDIEKLPFPDWSRFPIGKYSYFPALNKKPVLTMLTSRGCPYSCSFYCPYPVQMGKKWRARSSESIIKEIEYLKEAYDIKAIDFRDPIFTLNRQRIVDFVGMLKAKKLNIIWSCETRIDCLDKELIKLMYEAGLRHINVGIESADHGVLKGSNRLPVNIIHQEEVISFCDKLNITIAAFYIFGLENDTEKSIRATIEYAKKLNTLVSQFDICTPYPGTPFFANIKGEGRLTSNNWQDYDAYTPVFKHKFLTADKLLSLKEYAFVSYYFRIRYLMKYWLRILF